ncbi:MAG: hypothetical protein HQK50_02500 [Oligoflexia bacterium]|nr:hypothetical protein [Oligoflexia bacterium]
MKKNAQNILILLAFVVTLLFISFWPFQESDNAGAAKISTPKSNLWSKKKIPQEVSPPLESASLTLKQLFRDGRTSGYSSPQIINGFSDECIEYLSQILEIDLNNFSLSSVNDLTTIIEHSCQKLPHFISSIRNEVIESCREFFASEQVKREKERKCYNKIFLYRATISDHFSRKMSIEQVEDPKILIDRLFARTAAKDYQDARKVAQKLSFIYPYFYFPEKANAIFLMSDLLTRKRGNNHKNKVKAGIEELELSLERLQNIQEETETIDGEFEEMKLVSRSIFARFDLEVLEEEYKGYAEQYPNSSLGAYYLASVYHKMGKRDESIANIKIAIKLNPQEKRYHQTLQLLEKAQKSDPIFSVNLTFDLSDVDY